MNKKQSPMEVAFTEAEAARWRGEVPVGAVIVSADGTIVASAGNNVEKRPDPTGHAEVIAIREAARKLGEVRLTNCDLYVTLEPCPMCAQAIAFARIRRVYYGTPDPKAGGIDHGPRIFQQPGCNHRPEVYGGVQETRAADMLRKFFAEKRRS